MAPAASSAWELLFNRFVQYHAATSLCHLFKLVRRISTLDSLVSYNEQYEFTPGFFLPGILNVLINYFLFAVVTLLLVIRPDSSLLRRAWLPFVVFHFLSIPLRVPNHYIVVLFVAIVVFFTEVCLLCCRGNGKGSFSSFAAPLSTWIPRQVAPEEVYQTALSAIKILYAFTYGFATFHKLNHSYFDTAETPVRRIFRPVFLSVGWKDYPQDHVGYLFLAAGSIWIEGSLSTLPMLWPHQRRWILIQGLFFHCMTVLAGAPDYSAIIVSFYPLFTDDPIEPLKRNWKLVCACLPVTAIFWRCSFLFSTDYHPPKNSLFWHIAEPLEFFSVLLWFQSWLLLLYLNRTSPSPSSPFSLPFTSPTLPSSSPSSPSPSTGAGLTYQQLTDLRGFHVPQAKWAKLFILVVCGIYAVNCMGPYMGVKFEWSQAMYSQLKYDGSNHLFMPTWNSKENIYLFDVKVTPAKNVTQELMDQKRGLEIIMDGGTVQRQFFWAGVSGLCKRPEYRPVGVMFNDHHVKIKYDDICEQIPLFPNWFGLYPPKAKMALLGL